MVGTAKAAPEEVYAEEMHEVPAEADGDGDQSVEEDLEDYEGVHPPLSGRSLGCFSVDNPVRKAVYRLVWSKPFTIFIFVCIILNLFTLGIEEPGTQSTSWQGRMITVMDGVFASIFTSEMFLKIFAFGLVRHNHSYLRAKWNWLDAFVVVLGFLYYVPYLRREFTFIRSFRVLRILKLLNVVPGLRHITETLLHSLAPLRGVFLLTVFFISMFSIVGQVLFAGILRRRCVATLSASDSLVYPVRESMDQICPDIEECTARWGSQSPGADGIWECLEVGDNPIGYGYVGYDHFPLSFLTVTQVFTLDGWDAEVMDPIRGASSNVTALYFVIALMVGAFFVVNLMLAVVSDSYNEIAEGEQARTPMAEIILPDPVSVPTMSFAMQKFTCLSDCGAVRVDVMLRRPKNELDEIADFMADHVLGFLDDDETRSLDRETVSSNDVSVHTVEYYCIDGTAHDGRDYVASVGTVAFEPGQVKKSIFIDVIDNVETYSGRTTFLLALRKPSQHCVVDKGDFGKARVMIVDVDKPGSLSLARRVRTPMHPKVASVPVYRLEGTDGVISVKFETADQSGTAEEDYVAATGTIEFGPGEKLKYVDIKINPLRDWTHNSTFSFQLSEPSAGVVLKRERTTVVIRGVEPGRIRQISHQIITNKYFQLFILFMILVNVLCLAADGPYRSERTRKGLKNANLAFTFLFFVELVLKLVGLDFWDEFFPEKFNWFDCVVVVTSLLEISVSTLEIREFSGIGMLKTFRILRVFKLARDWKSFRLIIAQLIGSLVAVFWLGMVIALYLIVFALMGMQIFAGRYDDVPEFEAEGGKPRFNFDSFFWAVMNIVRILIGQWVVGAREAAVAYHPLALSFFVVAMLIGIFLLLNLFLAVLLGNVGDDDESDSQQQKKLKEAKAKAKKKKEKEKEKDVPPVATDSGASASDSAGPFGVPQEPARTAAVGKGLPKVSSGVMNPTMKQSRHAWDEGDSSSEDEDEEAMLVGKQEEEDLSRNHRVLCLPPGHPVRIFSHRVVTHWAFEIAVLVVICASCITLAIEDKSVHPNSAMGYRLFYANLVFTIFFSVEMLLKWMTFGVVLHPGSYFRNGWNCLDFIVVVISWLSILAEAVDITSLKAARALRAFRALARFEGMRVVINSLVAAVPSIFNVVIICGLFYLNFAILAVQLYGGTFGQCTDAGIQFRVDCVDALLDPATNITVAREWVIPEYNFDTCPRAMIALLKVATFDNWEPLFFAAVDSTGIDEAPEENSSPSAAVFFVVFMIIGSFFILNLFVGVLVGEFNKLTREYGGFALLSDAQREYRAIMLHWNLFKPRTKITAPEGGLLHVYRLVESRHFKRAMRAVVLVNMLVMAMTVYNGPAVYTLVLESLNYAFVAAYLGEFLCQVSVMGRLYFRSKWRQYNLLIVVTSVIGMIIDLSGATVLHPNLGMALRIFRVGRVLEILNNSRSMRQSMMTLVYAAPSLVNVGSLLCIVVFVYAVVGMNFCGEAEYYGDLTRETNFKSFLSSLVVLLKLSTGPGWSGLIKACGQDSTFHYGLSVLYFVSYLVIMFLVMINLYIAVILDSYEQAIHEHEATVTPAHINQFGELWAKHDPLATYTLKVDDVVKLLEELEPPLGYNGTPIGSDRTKLKQLVTNPAKAGISTIRDPHKKEVCLYYDLFIALIKNAMGRVSLPKHMDEELEERILKSLPVAVRELEKKRRVAKKVHVGKTLDYEDDESIAALEESGLGLSLAYRIGAHNMTKQESLKLGMMDEEEVVELPENPDPVVLPPGKKGAAKFCSNCKRTHAAACYTQTEWKKQFDVRWCRYCLIQLHNDDDEGAAESTDKSTVLRTTSAPSDPTDETLVCSSCNVSKGRSLFPSEDTRRCEECVSETDIRGQANLEGDVKEDGGDEAKEETEREKEESVENMESNKESVENKESNKESVENKESNKEIKKESGDGASAREDSDSVSSLLSELEEAEKQHEARQRRASRASVVKKEETPENKSNSAASVRRGMLASEQSGRDVEETGVVEQADEANASGEGVRPTQNGRNNETKEAKQEEDESEAESMKEHMSSLGKVAEAAGGLEGSEELSGPLEEESTGMSGEESSDCGALPPRPRSPPSLGPPAGADGSPPTSPGLTGSDNG